MKYQELRRIARDAVERVRKLDEELGRAWRERDRNAREAVQRHERDRCNEWSGVLRFIDSNRRSGTTSALVHAAIVSDGILVVGSSVERGRTLREYRDLRADQVVTVRDIQTWRGVGNPMGRPMMFDTTAIWELQVLGVQKDLL